MSKPFYFYSHRKKGGYLSQFYPSKFTVDGETYCCAEQWMMAQKAKLMGDDGTFEKVMAEKNGDAADAGKCRAAICNGWGCDPHWFQTPLLTVVSVGAAFRWHLGYG